MFDFLDTRYQQAMPKMSSRQFHYFIGEGATEVHPGTEDQVFAGVSMGGGAETAGEAR